MPFYSFQCESCGKKFEELVPYDRRGEVSCPDCQSQARVLVAAFAVSSGGSGGVSAPPSPGRSSFT